MNEKFKTLLEDVGLGIQHDGIVLTKPTVASEALEKFAELIVNECIKAVDNTNTHHVHTTFDDMLVQTTIEKSKKSIKQHFGLS